MGSPDLVLVILAPRRLLLLDHMRQTKGLVESSSWQTVAFMPQLHVSPSLKVQGNALNLRHFEPRSMLAKLAGIPCLRDARETIHSLIASIQNLVQDMSVLVFLCLLRRVLFSLAMSWHSSRCLVSDFQNNFILSP